MGKKTYIGPGPECPRCRQPSKLYRKSKNNPQSRVSAYCENADCVTKSFPPNSKKLHPDRVKIGDGPPCFRCLQTTVAWKHPESWRPEAGKGFYTFWYQCLNEACTTNQIMPPEAYQKPSRAA